MLGRQSKPSINLLNALYETPKKGLNLTQVRTHFYNRYKHGPTKIANPKFDTLGTIKDFFGPKGIEFIKEEATRIAKKPFRTFLPKTRYINCTNIFDHFDSDESIKGWKPVADSDTLNGFSTSSFTRSVCGHGLFRGVLDTRVPDDGSTMKSGFAAIIGPNAPRDSLTAIETYWDWTKYTTFEIRYRGDGRKYLVSINTGTYTSDLEHYDLHSYPLHTRGGPYWQTLRIPLSKFIFTYGSIIQDAQGSFPAKRVKFVSIAIQDQINGPFELEIDYMGLRLDQIPFHEITPYESYSHPHIKFRPIQVGCAPPDQDA